MNIAHCTTTLALVLLAPIGARADQLCQSIYVPLANGNWTQPALVARFDPDLGALTLVRVSFTGLGQGTLAFESTGSLPANVMLQWSASIRLRRPDASRIQGAGPSAHTLDSVPAFDGLLDFAGASGRTYSDLSPSAAPVPVSLSAPGDLALFSATSGNPTALTLSVDSIVQGSWSGPGNLAALFDMQSGALIDVCYDYTPAPRTFCSGDGSASACPCGNAGASGRGCENSFFTGGARLDSTGVASLSNDSVLLHADGLPPTAPCLFFQGTEQQNSGLGTLFGDGLLCAGGTLVRLGTTHAAGGAASFPDLGDAPVSVQGRLPPGGATRFYQARYRNAASSCGSGFNTTNGLRIVWQP